MHTATRGTRETRAAWWGWLAGVGRDVINSLAAQATRLGDALTALAAAALRPGVVPHAALWTLIGQMTRGRLVARPAPARPG